MQARQPLGKAGRDHHRVGTALQRLEHRHRGAHAERPRLVRRGQDDATLGQTCGGTVFEPERLPLTEDHPLRPVNPYGKTKLVVERALQRDEFEPYYQPILSLVDGSLVGFEALMRWNHPVRGLVPPAEFLSIAEETGGTAQFKASSEAAIDQAVGDGFHGLMIAQAGLLERAYREPEIRAPAGALWRGLWVFATARR